jgi:hypothetical protein
MINWVIILVLGLLILLVLTFSHLRHRFTVVLFLLFCLFVYGTILVVSSSTDLNFDTASNLVESGELYFGWLGNGLGNVKTIVGNAIKMDWTSTESDLFNLSKS